MLNDINHGMPFRETTEMRNSVSVFFLTKPMQSCLVENELDIFTPGTYDLLRKMAAPSDIAFNCVLDKLLKEHVYFLDKFELGPKLKDNLQPTKQSYKEEYKSLLSVLCESKEQNDEVISFLNDSTFQKEKPYVLKSFGHVLTVGVETGFLKHFSSQKLLLDFYRNCLEFCQSAMRGSDLRDSALFRIFVKLSILN